METVIALIIQAVIATAVSYGISLLIQRKPKDTTQAQEIEYPTALDGRPLPIVFGKTWLKSPNVLWHGPTDTTEPAEYVLDYWVRIHMGLCRSGIDGITRIVVGEKVVYPVQNDWTTEALDGQTRVYIDAVNIFGGKHREGGVRGYVDILYGWPDQARNAFLVSQLGEDIPAFRGMVSVVLNRVYIGTSNYLKPWWFQVKATGSLTDGSERWYYEKANVGDDNLNAVHIVHQCLTDTTWGLGKDLSDPAVDAEWRAAADVLYNEGCALSDTFTPSGPDSIKQYLQETILKAAGAILYTDMATGTFHLGLMRADYDPDDLPEYDEDDIVDVETFVRPSYGDIPNRVIVKWSDPKLGAERIAIAEDIAILDKQDNNPIELEIPLPCVRDETLANQIASRELHQFGSMLATVRLIGTRRMSKLHPNSVFKWSWADLGIESMTLRVVRINYGTLTDPQVTIDAVEDVFGTTNAIYGVPPESETESGGVCALADGSIAAVSQAAGAVGCDRYGEGNVGGASTVTAAGTI